MFNTLKDFTNWSEIKSKLVSMMNEKFTGE